jgi:hypothetical protein
MYGPAGRRKAHSSSGVAGDEMRPAIPFDETPVLSTHRDLFVQHTETGSASEQHDNPWVDDVDLLTHVDAAVSDICRGRFASPWAVFDRTGEIDSLLVQADVLDRAPEPLTRLSNERPSCFGFASSRRFTDEDNLGVGAPLASDGFADAPSLALPAGLDVSGNLS